jgi:hypothetical protein
MTLMARRNLRKTIGVLAVGAGIVLLGGPPETTLGNTLLYVSIIVLLGCLILWLLLLRGKLENGPAENQNP